MRLNIQISVAINLFIGMCIMYREEITECAQKVKGQNELIFHLFQQLY